MMPVLWGAVRLLAVSAVPSAAAAPLELLVSPEASVELLPAVQPDRAEILIYGNRIDLRAQLRDGRFDGIQRINAIDMGDIWVINARLLPGTGGLTLQPAITGAAGRWIAAPDPLPPVAPLTLVAPGLAGLEAAAPPACPASTLPIAPLQREDMSYGLEPLRFHIAPPRWTDAEPAAASWEAVAELRAALFVRHEQPDRAAALYRLGALHRDLGHVRESAYYFGQAAKQAGAGAAIRSGKTGGKTGGKTVIDAPDPALPLILLQQSSVLLQAARWEESRAAAWAAARAGAPEDAVLEILGVLELAESGPHAAVTALALARASARPAALALAGALLMQEGCPALALPILGAALPWLRRLDPRQATESRAMLADALILSGRLDEADDLLASIGERELSDDMAGILRARSRLIALLRLSPDQWSSMAPALDGFRNSAAPSTTEAAESLFLLGQIQEWLGDDQAAIGTWQRLLDQDRRLERGEPAARLADAWSRRNARLYEEGRELEALALHLAVWRPGLSTLLDDPTPLRRLAGSWQRLGIYHRAVGLLGAVAEMEGRLKLDDQDTILQIATIYLQMGHPELTEDALQVLRTRAVKPEISGAVRLLEGRIAEQAGDAATARSRYTAASAVPATAPEARARLAWLSVQAGDCAAALPGLEAALEDPGARESVGEGNLRAWRAECLSRRQNPEGAAVEGFLAAQALHAPTLQRLAAHLSTENARRADLPVPGAPAPPDPPDVWSLIEAEEETAATFALELAGR